MTKKIETIEAHPMFRFKVQTGSGSNAATLYVDLQQKWFGPFWWSINSTYKVALNVDELPKVKSDLLAEFSAYIRTEEYINS